MFDCRNPDPVQNIELLDVQGTAGSGVIAVDRNGKPVRLEAGNSHRTTARWVSGDDLAGVPACGVKAIVQVTSANDAATAQECGADGLIVKGNESGGLVGEETTFILLQRVVPAARIPVFARGGIGLHTAAACLAAGAAGVVLDWQLALCEEQALPESVCAKLSRMDGSETAILGQDFPLRYRAYARPGETAYFELKALEEQLGGGTAAGAQSWQEAVESCVREHTLLAIGQDACFARYLSAEFRTVGSVCNAVAREAARQCRVAARQDVLREQGPLAQAHGTRYPIVQGPMTRVSDRADFAVAVAEGGALPFSRWL